MTIFARRIDINYSTIMMEQEERLTGEIVLYQPDETIRLEVRVENETVWLNRQQIASLFGRDVKTIGKHINNALKEELINIPTVAKFAIVQYEGNRIVNRSVDFYNLDMILSIGYRVKSEQGIRFRQWANNILKKYLLSGYAINQQISEIKQTIARQGREITEIRNKVDFFVQISLPMIS